MDKTWTHLSGDQGAQNGDTFQELKPNAGLRTGCSQATAQNKFGLRPPNLHENAQKSTKRPGGEMSARTVRDSGLVSRTYFWPCGPGIRAGQAEKDFVGFGSLRASILSTPLKIFEARSDPKPTKSISRTVSVDVCLPPPLIGLPCPNAAAARPEIGAGSPNAAPQALWAVEMTKQRQGAAPEHHRTSRKRTNAS